MSGSQMAHWLWKEFQLTAPPVVQRAALPALHRLKEIARVLSHPYISLYELKGCNDAGPLTVAYGGLGYAKPMLQSLLFTEDPAQREVRGAVAWRPGELAAASDCDLMVIEASRLLIQELPRRGAIILPFRLQFALDLQGEWEQVESRFRPQTRRRIHKQRRSEGYESEISQREGDLKMFYERMYLPTVRQRHGELAAILPEREALQLVRHGRLFLIRRKGQYVCGSLILARDGILESVEMGVLGGSVELMKEGVVDILHYLCIRWAHEQGYSAFSLGDCWPYLSGAFYSKHKWGMAVSVPSHEHKQIWIRICRDTPAVREFVTHNPCVTVDGRGNLDALLATDEPGGDLSEMMAASYRLYETPGIRGLRVCSIPDLMGDAFGS